MEISIKFVSFEEKKPKDGQRIHILDRWGYIDDVAHKGDSQLQYWIDNEYKWCEYPINLLQCQAVFKMPVLEKPTWDAAFEEADKYAQKQDAKDRAENNIQESGYWFWFKDCLKKRFVINRVGRIDGV